MSSSVAAVLAWPISRVRLRSAPLQLVAWRCRAVALHRYEMDDIFPYNAGIMLMNMPYLRQTNKQFIDWILEQRNGLYFDGALPVGAGGRGGCSAVYSTFC